jgi:hypothetical protein
MPDLIRYDLLAQDALRSVVRKVLLDVAKHGLPGEHHFFIAFDTRAEGVKVSERLRAAHPEEMTIVLQHQFWDLAVGEKAFEVGLSFKGVPERVTIPFAAIKGFFDPSVQFGLQFETITEAQAMPAQAANESKAGKSMEAGGDRHAPRPTPRGAASEPEERPASSSSRGKKKTPSAPAEQTDKAAKHADKAAGAEVVSLDKFRKK